MVVVDTSVWSLFLRRRSGPEAPALKRLKQLLAADDVVLFGIIHQELLSGVRHAADFARIDAALSGFDEVCASVDDHRRAAEFYNRCRAKGVQGTAIDFLICAMAERRKLSILTTDGDFVRYARLLPITLDPYEGVT